MPWSSAFYFGGSEAVLLPIETISFEAFDTAGFAAQDFSPVFETGDTAPVFDFTGEPEFQPIEDGADFNVEC